LTVPTDDEIGDGDGIEPGSVEWIEDWCDFA